MNNIINVNALREALESGMSATTIHQWIDDTLIAMGYLNENYPTSGYVAVSRKNLEQLENTLTNLELSLLMKSLI